MKFPLIKTIAIFLTCTSIALADCPAGCPGTSTGPTQTSNNGTNNGTNTGIANPVAGISNNNVNVVPIGANAVSSTSGNCQPDTLSPFFTQSSNAYYGGTTSYYGIAANIALNHAAYNECMNAIRIIDKQRENDTLWGNYLQCFKIDQAGGHYDSPMLGKMCDGYIPITRAVVQAPAPVVQPTPRVETKLAVYNNAPTCITDKNAWTELPILHKFRHEYQRGLHKLHPSQLDLDLQAKVAHLSKVCGVTPADIWQALDG